MQKGLKLGVLVFVFLVFSCPVGAEGLPPVEIHFLDVGQGDAIWIKGPKQTNILIDAGNLSVGYKVRDYLLDNGVRNLDAVIVTHTHPDHVGGLFGILPDVGVDKILDNGASPVKNDDFALEYLNFVNELNLNRAVLTAGESLSFGALHLHVLSPSRPLSGNLNADSLVIRVSYGGVRVLLMADATQNVEHKLVEKEKRNLASQVIKVGHHGWTDATSKAFLDCVKPEIAVISVGKGNRYGYPSTAVVEQIQSRGTTLLRTDVDGTIVLTTDGEKIKLTQRHRAHKDS